MPGEFSQEDWDAVQQEREGSAPPVQSALPEASPQTSPQEQAPAAQAEQAADPYEGLHPEIRQRLTRLDELTAAMPSLVNDLKAAKGRVAYLQSEWDKVRQNGQAGGPSAAQIATAAKDPDSWARLKSDFPEWGEGIQAFVDHRLGQLSGAGFSQEQVEQLVAQRTDEARRELGETFLEFQFKGWKDEVKTPEFELWFRAQPADVQALAASANPADAARMLGSYREHKAKPVASVEQTRQQRLSQAATVVQGARPGPVKSFEEMTPEEQWNYLAAQREKT